MNDKLLKNLEALVITNPTNIRYLTGFIGMAPEEREAYVLLTINKTYLFTNALYLEQAKLLKLDSDSGAGMTENFEIVEISQDVPLSKKLAEVLISVIPGPLFDKGTRNRSYIKTGSRLKGRDDKIGLNLGFEENHLTVSEFQKLKKELRGVQLVPTKNRVEDMRMIKRIDEIVNIRKAAKITDDCFTYLASFLKPGVTEAQIAWEIESFFRKQGAQSAFSPIVAFGRNSSQPHYSISLKRSHLLRLNYQPSDSCKLIADSLVLLDFGARVNGYCSDMTRTIFIGKPKTEWKKAYDTVLSAQQAALTFCYDDTYHRSRAASKGISGARLDEIARKVIEKAGFPPYPHSLGHGVGLAIHEAPRLSIKNPSTTLRAGMVVTIEPGIYEEGSYGIRIEDLVLLKEDGIEIFSKSPKQLLTL